MAVELLEKNTHVFIFVFFVIYRGRKTNKKNNMLLYERQNESTSPSHQLVHQDIRSASGQVAFLLRVIGDNIETRFRVHRALHLEAALAQNNGQKKLENIELLIATLK